MTKPNKFSILSFGYAADVFLSALGMWLALTFARGYWGTKIDTLDQALSILAFTIAVSISLVIFRQSHTVWRWTTADDLLKLFQAIVAATVGTVAFLFFASPWTKVPQFVPAFAAIVTCFLSAGARGLLRSLSGGGLRALFRAVADDAPATILVGPTETITQAIHSARTLGPLPIRPIAIVSTFGNQVGKIFAGARVYGGLEHLEPLVVDALTHNPSVRIALVGKDPNRAAAQVALKVAGRKGVELMRIAAGAGATLGAVHPGDVLGRSRRVLDLSAPRSLVRYKRVLVTGAGGTIGSEIVRQIAQLGPSSIILVDSSENNLYQILTEVTSDFPALEIIARLCDVRDAKRINDLFDQFQPKVVVHAAANKHVPMMEAHFCQAIEVNLGGTCVVAEAAMAVDVESFVFVSTDKAVNPVNIMGAAKRIAELYIEECNKRSSGAFLSVRFGNVLGSSGSVMPLFERQIAKGGPITVTHKDMTRWFMTVEEASSLVLQAAALGVSSKSTNSIGQFVLDMGEPIKIMELAETMVRMKGKEPHRDIAIVETGLRPGERLHEDLFHTQEKIIETEVDGVLVASSAVPPTENFHILVENLLDAAKRDNTRAALEVLQRILPAYGRSEPGFVPPSVAEPVVAK
jgi:FlaA1/EpsC-like NDP-sugar epimerase